MLYVTLRYLLIVVITEIIYVVWSDYFILFQVSVSSFNKAAMSTSPQKIRYVLSILFLQFLLFYSNMKGG
jgi:hypothetical protein